MERIAIIDHANHRLFIEDIDEKLLEEKYNCEEEAYIKDMYGDFDEEWSWDYINSIEYFPLDCDGDCINLDNLADLIGHFPIADTDLLQKIDFPSNKIFIHIVSFLLVTLYYMQYPYHQSSFSGARCQESVSTIPAI